MIENKKVRCISTHKFLTSGKIYQVINSSHNSYQLLSSGTNWNSSWFHKVNFIDIDEWRDRQLKKLGIE